MRALGPEYWKLWTATAVSNLGDGVRLAAFPLVAAALTRDAAAVAAVTFVGQLPWILFGLVAGVVADRADRRRVMVAADAFRAAVAALFALAVLTDAASLPLLYVTAFLLGTAETFFDNAAQSILPALVPRDRLDAANGPLLAAERGGNELVGPAFGGPLFAAAAVAPFLFDAASFAVAALLVFAVRGSFRPERPRARPRLGVEVADGLRFVRRDRAIGGLIGAVAVLAIVDSAWFSILVLYALEVLDLGATGFALLLLAGGVDGLGGSLGAARVSRRFGVRRVLAGALVVAAATQLVLGLTTTPAVAWLMLLVSGGVFGVWNVVALSLRQSLVPDPLLGRVNAAYRVVGVGSYAVGALLGGVLAESVGLRAPFLVGVPFLLAAAALAARSAGPRNR